MSLSPLRLLVPLAALALAAAPAAGQVRGPENDTVPRPTRGDIARDRGEGPLLDAPVSRTEYRLGPGDQVDVALFGEFNDVYTLSVTPEGSLLIPGVGIARVLGLNLEQAEDRVRAVVGRYYRNIEVRLALSRVRSFKVFVVGDVPDPGVRLANAAMRVSEVVGPPRDPAGPRRRTVTLRRADGDTLEVDLVRFTQLGDIRANPTLREGDAVVVPAIDEYVDVQGRVVFAGGYQYRPGETLAELLDIANGGGGFPADAADTLRLVRTADDGTRSTLLLSRAEAEGARGRGIVLQPFDAIYLPRLANFREQKWAQVQGQVVKPGRYPIRPDTTTVRELVAMAGGFTPEASLLQATLRRGEPPPVLAGELSNVPPELMTGDERRIQQIRAQGNPTTVVVDFIRLFAAGGDAYDQPLQHGDVLDVPRRTEDVTVIGAVVNPGVLHHVPGEGISYYIRAAGGYTRRADRRDVVVLRARNGARVHWRDVAELDPGDTVVVPFSPDRNWADILTTANAIVGTIAGLALTAIAVF